MKPPAKRGAREARTPMNRDMTIVEQAEEHTILAAMRPWPGLQEDRLKAAGYTDFGDGEAVLQAMFESKLADPREVDALACIKWLAERGFRSAQEAILNYAQPLLEAGGHNLPAPLLDYVVNFMRGRVALHPPDVRNDVVRNMLRDIGIAAMVKVAAIRWGLPKLNSSGCRHSAAWFVAAVMTDYGHPLTERQVRRIVQTYSQGFGKRLSDFLLAGAERTI
jgi:hypothetical protein